MSTVREELLTEGYDAAKTTLGAVGNCLCSKHVKALPTIGDSNQWKIHQFYEKFFLQALETRRMLKEVNGIVSTENLEGLRNLVRTNDDW